MLTVPFAIRDSHGINHDNAVVVINHFNATMSSSTSGSLDLGDRSNPQYHEPVQPPNKNIGFNALLFKDQTAFNAGAFGLPLRDINGNEWFNVSVEENLEGAAAVVPACEQYLLTTILEALKVVPDA